jgi:transposase
MGQRKTFTPECRREVVELLESESRQASQLARELGIKRKQLHKWQTELKGRARGGEFPGSGRRHARLDEGRWRSLGSTVRVTGAKTPTCSARA